jgi:hypothetical protein
MHYKDCTLYRIAHGDDGDVEEFTVTVAYELHPPDSDVGIIEPWPEIHSVYDDKTRIRITDEEFDALVEQLSNR